MSRVTITISLFILFNGVLMGRVPETLAQAPAAPASLPAEAKPAAEKTLSFEDHMSTAAELAKKEKFEEAVKEFEAALALDPNNVVVENWLGYCHQQLGFNFQRQDKQDQAVAEFEKAIHNFERAVELDPDYAEGHNNVASVYQQLSRYDKAEEGYKKALLIKPDFKEARFNL